MFNLYTTKAQKISLYSFHTELLAAKSNWFVFFSRQLASRDMINPSSNPCLPNISLKAFSNTIPDFAKPCVRVSCTIV